MLRRRSPSTTYFPISARMASSSCSVRSRILRSSATPVALQISAERLRPMPKMYVSAMTVCLLSGTLTPAIRAINPISQSERGKPAMLANSRRRPHAALPLALLVTSVSRANHAHGPVSPDYPAVTANLLNRSTYLHGCVSEYQCGSRQRRARIITKFAPGCESNHTSAFAQARLPEKAAAAMPFQIVLFPPRLILVGDQVRL